MAESRSDRTVEYIEQANAPVSASQPWLNVLGSRHFLDWLAEQRISLAFTTYQTGKMFFVGRKPDHAISVFERTFNHCMGLWAAPDAQTLWLSTKFQIWRFEKAPAQVVPHAPVETDQPSPGSEIPAWVQRGYDVAYVPRVGYTTGDLDVHDVAVDAQGRVIFISTLFGCLATLSERASFQPLWRPPFLSGLVPEDRCHLNGLAMRDGRAAFVTVVARSDVADGWRDRRRDGGCVIDVASGETVTSGLSMPHSPRWYRDRLWVLNSGTGEFGHVDLGNGKFEPIAFCPGYLRGMAFAGDYAVVTLSKPRHVTFHGLELDDRLSHRGAEPQCGLQVIDLRTGTIAHWLRLDGTLVTELYDSVVLPGVRQPMAVGFKTNEIERLLLVDEEGVL
ncbi:MAG: TIGR03032 family protein [Planctomycetales bacterium]|nr:TIGR03032 family protein [Planctomycetales bacterium]